MNVVPGCRPIRFSQIPERTRLAPVEAVALVLAAAAACDESIPGIEGLPLPPAEQILLEFDGRVRVEVPSPPGDDAQRVLAAAMLLKRLLALDDAPGGAQRPGVPGALLVLLARAFGTIDLPAPSFEDLRRALGRFRSGEDRVSLPRVYARSARPGTDGDGDSTTATPISMVPVRQIPERRQHGARVSDLRRELRMRDREIFEALARQPRRAPGVPLVAALAICALAFGAGALLVRGAMDLLERQPLVWPRALIEQVSAVRDRAPALTAPSPAGVSAATRRRKSASTAGSNSAPEPLPGTIEVILSRNRGRELGEEVRRNATRSLAALEGVVHTDPCLEPTNLVAIRVDISEDLATEPVDVNTLPRRAAPVSLST